MRIHLVIFIAQLESVSNQTKNSYFRASTQLISSIIEKDQNQTINPEFTFKYKLYEIERLLERRDTKNNIKYLIK